MSKGSALIPAMRILLAIIALVAFVVIAGVFQGAIPSPEADDALGNPIQTYPPGLVSTAKAVGLLLLGGWLLGQLASIVGFSKITGYLVFGMIASPNVGAFILGPDAPWILSTNQQPYLTLVNDLAIALIALTAGGKINLREVRDSFRSVSLILAFEFTLVLIVVATLMSFMLGANPIFAEYGGLLTVILVATVIGIVATANSPAVVIAVLSETKADGPMASTAIAVTVCKDLLLIIVFAIALALATSAAQDARAAALDDPNPDVPAATLETAEPDAGPNAETGAEATVADAASKPDAAPQPEPVWLKLTKQIGGSMVGGVLIGIALAWYLRKTGAHLPIVLTLGSFAIALISAELGLKTLIVGLAAGLTVANRYQDQKPNLFGAVEDLSVPVYVLFFAVAGAKIDPSLLAEVWTFVIALVALRTLAIWIGTGIGCRLSGLEKPAATWIWTAFVPQAGISLALAVVVADSFQHFAFSDKIYAILLSSIAVHELLGPILFKKGLQRAGEAHA
jgi:Kef-type K+ transport system membrane component KefB